MGVFEAWVVLDLDQSAAIGIGRAVDMISIALLPTPCIAKRA
jgi:hypothetical protein